MRKHNLENEPPEYIEYLETRRKVRMARLLPVGFFGLVGGIVVVSMVRQNNAEANGAVSITSEAMEVAYMTSGVSNTVYPNSDPLDDSYGDYYYLGPDDFYEIGVENEFEVYGHLGLFVCEGTEVVESVSWVCSEDVIDEAELAEIAEDLCSGYGDCEAQEDGTYWWYADSDGTMKDVDNLAWMTVGINEDGMFYLEAGYSLDQLEE